MRVDAVYTWVNHEDAKWKVMHKAALAEVDATDFCHESVNSRARFHNRNELTYSINSLKKYAPWIDNIFIVTNCELPPSLIGQDNIHHVPHEDVFPDPEVLPTFNSRAIESNLHRVPGVAEHFIYFNDDVFLCRPVDKNVFFPSPGFVHVFPSKHDIPYQKTVDLRPVDFGILNACELLINDFEYRPRKKLHHAPFPLLKSRMEEIESMYLSRFVDTRQKKFRDENDLPLATTLHAYFAVANGYGVLEHVDARYVDIGDLKYPLLVHRFSRLRRGKYAFLCLNEVSSPNRHFGRLSDWIVARLMKKMFEET